MTLADRVNTFGQVMVARHGERVHKIAIDAGFSCPNRDGSKGRGGCTFCNNVSFSPNGRKPPSIADQITAGKQVIGKRTGAQKYVAYFQAYTNTYADIERLRAQYDQALAEADVIGLSIGTRPDCVPPAVLDLLATYRDQGYEIWLELGLQSIFDTTLERVNRGHSLVEYEQAIREAQARHLNICTHLIIGLPGETERHVIQSLDHVLALGVQGLKLHPLHVVKGTRLANDWRRGEYRPLSYEQYINTVADLIERTPPEIIYHRITGTASKNILLAPDWCACKWKVLNGIESVLRNRHTHQGSHCGSKLSPSTILADSRADDRGQCIAHTL
ncbi:MAG: TIGR01212 family radical SAM protein [Gammaproteobacteria bacterium]|nr:MAG: TIGR01212 family radical SAM protein [Gammaproteobacteria bacterium]